ncbi:hypothetical protein GR210_18170 [Rhizobium leguminosarum]|uniref:hypothetical protein n=1 Tax=Rhizobium leguminosarum TaxID=384 RepID=UPI0013D8F50C|nr:hypothetical protein [Rhizobium leguminosarum]MBY5316742.1 hypothetical protein [Rhizobium leguminosarum]NEH50700.1 hypothetical protein [Rhizobium leguminosarum]
MARLNTLDLIFALKSTGDLSPYLIGQATYVGVITTVGMASGIISVAVLALRPDINPVFAGIFFIIFSVSLYNITAQLRRLLHISSGAFRAKTEVEGVRAFYKSSSLQQFLDAEDRLEIEKLFEQVAAMAKVLDGERLATLFSKWTSETSEEELKEPLIQIRKELEVLGDAIKQLAQAAPAETPKTPAR